MNKKIIIDKAEDLIARCDTRDPFKIARELNVRVLERGDFGKLKGMYKIILRNRFIFINSSLSERVRRITCAHELGHDRLHRDIALNESLHEISLYKFDTGIEYEANLFAASLLLDDRDVLDLAHSDFSAEQIARALESDVNLVSLKIDCLISKGYNLRKTQHRTDFLR